MQWVNWEPSLQNPYKGVVTWSVPENVEITVTLFREPKQTHFEDKEWTFIIEEVCYNINKPFILFDKKINKGTVGQYKKVNFQTFVFHILNAYCSIASSFIILKIAVL